MLDQYGHAQQRVTSIMSDPDSFESAQGDELRSSPHRAGKVGLTARRDYAVAEGHITVQEGATLPPGTIQWFSGGMPGCRALAR
jgi:hypothetical protein